MNIVKNIVILFASYVFTMNALGQSNLYVNEFLASNYATSADLDFSGFSDWIEIYNDNNESVDIGGFFLSDNLSDNQKWQIPDNTIIQANGYKIFWCDNLDTIMLDYHTNFRLNGGGEEIGFWNSSFNLIDSISFENQVSDVSYGRNPNNLNQWFYYTDPTPNIQNSTFGFLNNQQPVKPEFSLSSGFYTSGSLLVLSVSEDNTIIRYTIDGALPNENSNLYSGEIVLDSTIVLKARSYKEGMIPGKIYSRSYFIDEEIELPVISLTTYPDFLFDQEIGIYADQGIQFKRGWEREATIEYFDQDHDLEFKAGVYVRLFGNTAIFYPQKSLAVFPENPLEYKLFESRETEEYHSFILRSSSDDWPYTMMRDALMHSLLKDQINIDYQAYEPSVLFINGEYFGIHNIREKINENFLATYYDVDPNNIDLIFLDLRTAYIELLEGDLEDFYNTLDFVENNDLSIKENYMEACNLIDVENYVDFLATNIFYGNSSWHHNVKVWKEKVPGAKWRWLLYDLDRGISDYFLNNYNVIHEMDTSDMFFPYLMANEDFRALFLNRLSGFMNSTFKKERIIYFIDSLAINIENEIPAHSERWKDLCDNWNHCGIQSIEYWYEELEKLKNTTEIIHEKVRSYVMDYADLEGTVLLTINNENPDRGKILINNIEYDNSSEGWLYFKNVPLQIVAVSNEGFTFLNWEQISFNDTLEISLNEPLVLTVKFGTTCELSEVIEDDIVLNNDCDAYYTLGDLTITSGASVTIPEGLHIFISPGDSIHVNGQLTVNGSENEPVYFRTKDDNDGWGCINSPDGIIELNYLEFLNCQSAVVINDGELTVDHVTVHESPYFHGDVFAVHKANTIIQNSVINGRSDDGKTDIIDCDEIQYGLIQNNFIQGTTDDGIDIGTGSNNVIVSGNRVYDCESMGISVGEYSQVSVEYNIITGCEAGIQVHSEATAIIDHNTIYGNQVGIRCYHYSDEPNSGGHAIVSNSIFSGLTNATYELYENSTISFDYSLSDSEYLQGDGNQMTDPMFVDPDTRDFYLQENSPCINTGDPFFPLDPDNTRSDIGAIYFNHDSSYISEINGEKIFIYPSPANDYINIETSYTFEWINSVQIINAQGVNIKTIDNIDKVKLTLGIKDLSNGVYFANIYTSKGGNYSVKFVVLHK